jgi:hypothetical protein
MRRLTFYAAFSGGPYKYSAFPRPWQVVRMLSGPAGLAVAPENMRRKAAADAAAFLRGDWLI